VNNTFSSFEGYLSYSPCSIQIYERHVYLYTPHETYQETEHQKEEEIFYKSNPDRWSHT